MADDTVESLHAELIGMRAQLSEVNGESKGHRLNATNARKEGEAMKATLESQIAALSGQLSDVQATAATKLAESERQAGEKVTAAETKAAEAAAKAAARVVTADLKVAAKDANANDIADVIALLDRSKLVFNDEGEVTNAGPLIADLKKAKPYLFGSPSTSHAGNPPPQTAPAAKHARDMTPDERMALARTLGVTGRR